MDPETLEHETPVHTTTRGDPVSGSGIMEDAQSLWHELLELIHDRFRLAALETRRAGESLIVMLISAVMAAVLLISAWLGLMVAAVFGLVENGVAVSSAILLAVAFNLLLALILFGVIRRKSCYLQFPATLRRLQPLPPKRHAGNYD